MKTVFAWIGAAVCALIVATSIRLGLPALGFEREAGQFWSGYAMGALGGAWFWRNLTS